jgi:nitrogen-specific signal transduction histidine kinase
MSADTCVIYSSSAAWVARLRAFLTPEALVRACASATAVETEVARQPGQVVLLDLQTAGTLELAGTLRRRHPEVVLVAFGQPGSDPLLEAERLDLYAVEDLAADRRRVLALVRRALVHLALLGANRLLRRETERRAILQDAASHAPAAEPALTMRDLSAALRHFGNVDALLQRLADEAAGALEVSRVGIFALARDGTVFRLRANLRCLDASAALEFPANHPFVLWLTLHTHVVARITLDHVADPADRLMLQGLLDQLGAEVLIPLHARNRLLGWLFVGHQATGLPFQNGHLHELSALGDCVSTTLDHAMLFEEMTLQKTLAETLLRSIPSGIIAVDQEGIIRWCNAAGLAALARQPEDVQGKPVETLGSRLADLLRRTLGENGGPQAIEGLDPVTRRRLVIRTQRLTASAQCLGAMAILQDITDEAALAEKKDRLDRATFWAELAACMSHEVRNPLVAIKTFSQLLPERYADPEFRDEFKTLVIHEIDRLNEIVEQIHRFAHPAPLHPAPLNVAACLERVAAKVVPASIRFQLQAPESLPRPAGDEHALSETFAHLLTNAVEALAGRPKAAIAAGLREARDSRGQPCVELHIRDNGPGLAPDILEKLYSPFCTTKARGMGLGLPIARRTILDHGGELTIQGAAQGTQVVIRLPLAPHEKAGPS